MSSERAGVDATSADVSLIVADLNRCEVLARLLDRCGCRLVSVAGSVEDGVAKLDGADPDVIVIDAELPDGDGIHLCQSLTKTHPTTKIIIQVTRRTVTVEVAALAAGASAVVEISIRGTALLRALSELIDGCDG